MRPAAPGRRVKGQAHCEVTLEATLAAPAHQQRLLRDIEGAILHWGYRPLIPFHSLSMAHRRIVDRLPLDPLALQAALPSHTGS